MSTQKHAKTYCMESSDNELVQQALAGGTSGFEMLVERYNLMLTNWAYRILRNRQQVADVLQFVYLQLFLSLGTLYPDNGLSKINTDYETSLYAAFASFIIHI